MKKGKEAADLSFTSDIKSELTKLETPTCCKISECYGILLFGRAFSEKEISVSIIPEKGDVKAKAFIWDGVTGMKAMAENAAIGF